MTRNEFLELVASKIVVLDGATGAYLQEKGMPVGVCPEEWILQNPEVLIELQKDYLEAGTDIIYAPTFTANRIKLAEYGMEDRMKEMNQNLVRLSKEAVKIAKTKGRKTYVAGDLTMTGEQLYPMGTMLFEELVEVYKEQVAYILAEGVDLFIVETMMSLSECRAAVLAIKELCELPIMVTLTFNEDGRTLYGTDPKTAVIVMQSMGVDAVGVNCSTGPDQMSEVVRIMKQYAKIPIIAKPNAGLPKLVDNKTVFDMSAEEFAKSSKMLVEAGANIVGGCCGTTPSYIKLLTEEIQHMTSKPVIMNRVRALTTERSTLEIGLNDKFRLIGERINPTGKKALQAELKVGEMNLVGLMAKEQIENGADILDINMGMNGINEKEMMLRAMHEVIRVGDIPLCIDSSHISVIEAALRIYPGRALINSVSLESGKCEGLLPLAKKYGAMFILLPLSDQGLPKDMDEKMDIIHTILKRAEKEGLSKEDIIVDGLVQTIGANKTAALETFETIRYCKESLGLATMCGLSNISFGLPERQVVNSTFLALAIGEGLTMAIANPSQDLLVNTAFATDLLLAKDKSDLLYINRVANRPMTVISGATETKGSNQPDKEQKKPKIFEAVMEGNRNQIIELVKETLGSGIEPGKIIDELLIPAINEVGNLFDKQIYFLPQLIASAETMRLAIEYLEPMLKRHKDEKGAKTIIIATVAGDIHDIGKNLVALMLKNHGFTVIDMGKDVATETIIEKAKETKADIIALSALMTTTMMEMKQVVMRVREEGLNARVIIGGAVITQSYADEIGADAYASDAQDAVRVAKRLLKL